MLKKTIAGAATALLCSTASAGLVQYTLSDVRFSDGGTLEGFFVQDTDDNSIVYYWLGAEGGRNPGTGFIPLEDHDYITKARVNFYWGGPTSFRVEQYQVDAWTWKLHLGFRYGEEGGVAAYGSLATVPLDGLPDEYLNKPTYRSIIGGTAIAGALEPELVEFLASGGADGMVHIVPTRMPEPGSLALLAIGAAFGATRLRRRSQAA
ncbi:MAG: PEP-CTERM sorting domain-containing protein [Pseudomonadota bacterium]